MVFLQQISKVKNVMGSIAFICSSAALEKPTSFFSLGKTEIMESQQCRPVILCDLHSQAH